MIVYSKPIFQRYPEERKDTFSSSDEGRQFFYINGRVSLLHALKKIGMKAGDTIGIPAFFCQSGIEVAEENGFKCVFYDISKWGSISLENLQELVVSKHVNAILLVHYFGFHQENTKSILDFARDKKVRVIEDYCHSFLSYRTRNLKTGRSDAYTFSYRKTLAGVNIGALVLGEPQVESYYSCNSGRGLEIDINDSWVSWMERSIISRGLLNPYSECIDKCRAITQACSELLGKRKVHTEEVQLSSEIGWVIFDDEYLDVISEQRRQNYRRLSSIFVELGCTLLFPVLRKGVVPQIFPLLDASQKLLPLLRANGVGAYKWPGEEIPETVIENKNLFPNAMAVNKNIVCVPIHQDLGEKHFAHIRNVLMR